MAYKRRQLQWRRARETAAHSLDQPTTEELYRLGLLVPPGCRLAKPWRVNKDGYATQAAPATAEELRTHCYAPPEEAGGHPQPPPAAPQVPAEFDLPPEQVVLREDGDPDDTPGLLVALHASHATAPAAVAAEAVREEAEIAAAIQAAQALGAADPQPVVGDDDVHSDGLAVSSDDDGGSDGGDAGVGQDVVYVDESD
ncbi:hypothetical protein ZWY2020_019375 [Hordeum vulgare]|nr:hypothetical protein ZWY2020_019375 [Hordeum vulgare]